MSSDFLQFTTDQIQDISRQTLSHQSQWDEIWNTVRQNLSNTAAEALSKEPGGSLDARTQAYHKKTQTYTDQLQTQSTAVGKVGNTATEYNGQMTKVIAG